MNAYRISAGVPEPLGVTADAEGVNVAVFSAHATAIEFCLFDETGQEDVARVVLPEQTGDVFHGHIAGIGDGARYGMRAHGPWDPAHGHRFNSSKLLVDPYAVRLDRPFVLDVSMFDQRARGASRDDADSAPFVPKAVVEAAGRVIAPFQVPFRWDGQVFYELHVRGYTRLNPQVPLELRGTFAGLADPAAIAHLVRLGITTVELMPAMAWIDERHLPSLGLSNYWGYNPVVFGAPDPRLAPGGFADVRLAVEALHAAGISVVLDVVLNHTGESDVYGPTVSLRGLDNATYYRHATHDPGELINDAGTGNTLALESAPVLRLAMDSLRRWATTGLDGFRFDLAATLGRTAHGFDIHAPFFGAIGQDPLLRDRALIAEPWDIGPGGYQVGRFPAEWAEWNDHFRDTARKFWRGDQGMIGEVATRLAGSADVFAARRRPLSRAVNFVTAHDGFTLSDLVSYERKHNEANGEDNRDGTGDNHSWNHGTEGPTDDPAIIARRQADARALLATLLVARGTPMLTMGDECGRSQSGNNNAYAQDNALTWLDWSRMDEALVAFTASLVTLRREHPALRGEMPLTGRPLDASTLPDVEWRAGDGTPVNWQDPDNRVLVAVFYAAAGRGGEADRVAVVLNGDAHAADIRLPEARDEHDWEVRIDTSRAQAGTTLRLVEERFTAAARSVTVIVEKRVPDAPRRSADPALLERLAAAASIAAHWQDVSGLRHEVPDDTKRALLKAMRLPADTRGDASDSLVWLSEQTFARSVPEALVVREGATARLRLGGAAARATRRLELRIRLENGEERLWPVAPDEGERAELPRPDGRFALVRHISLPPLPLGRHGLLLDGESCIVTVAPTSSYVPPHLGNGGRASGIVAHLYALRRTRNDQGIGDFSALATLAEAAATRGAALVGLNPLHALFPHDRERASPYYPSDRRFLDPIYIDVAELAAPGESEALRAAWEAAVPVFSALGASGAVDYTAVWGAKRRVLAAAFDLFEAGGDAAFDRFVTEGGEALLRFATFTALAEQQGSDGWRSWPETLRQPDAPAVRAFIDANARAVRFALWQQWTADRHLQSAATRAQEAGLSVGFYRDLAVGTAPDGAEAWAEADRLMQGVTVGAPPDPLGPEGQNWNLPPPDPLALRADGYVGFARNVAANMRYAGALRIDHVMGLRRLFLIPQGASAAEGAYLSFPFEDMAGQVALESHRARCLVVGEDLGTVPFGMREQLSAENMLSYRVLWFERSTSGFMPPRDYPPLAAACVSTHDLPTLAGWWDGADIDERQAIRLEDEASAAGARVARRVEKETLAQALQQEGLIGQLPDFEAPLDDAFVAAVHGYVARSRSMLALTQIDDLAGETIGVNLPGTDRERPNWRRRLAIPVEEVLDTLRARAALDAMKAERG
ncbi:glycogen debranching protein GlgX [Ancylobacter sp. 6x-1]|uniref:4-alpha-glucanotransferase n=1 Tax=Ancylobacter crimeensis TaxID=2579147 RepID=A0ABT0D9I0_9HYPH|nr:glycogen debranching protein GlgX [Ancylobacter crimeensis]